MSVKINTKEKLDMNAYERIVIIEKNTGFWVKVSSSKPSEDYSFPSYKISDDLKDNTDYEKIVLIVESFLNDTLVDTIEFGATYYGYAGNFIKISGDRALYLQIKDNNLLRKLIKMVKMKYQQDRYNYFADSSDNNLYSIRFCNEVSSYTVKPILCEACDGCDKLDNVCPNYVEFKLMYNGDILHFDKMFISRFIYDKLWEQRVPAKVIANVREDKTYNGMSTMNILEGYGIVCGDLRINFNCSRACDEYVITICNNIVNRYNSELEKINKVKKRQLVMEGF